MPPGWSKISVEQPVQGWLKRVAVTEPNGFKSDVPRTVIPGHVVPEVAQEKRGGKAVRTTDRIDDSDVALRGFGVKQGTSVLPRLWSELGYW